MLWTASGIKGYAILASDGKIGTVADFLFDDDSWLVRWLVVDTGTWLSGRKVLLPAFVLGHADPAKREFPVRLTMAQVKGSPEVDTEKPVSRQMEFTVYDYYGWRPYWGAGFYMGGFGYAGDSWTGAPSRASSRREEQLSANARNNDDPHLRSVAAVTGYHIDATDGEIGHVEDMLVDDADWSIHYLVIDTKNWWPAKKVLISPASVHDINWSTRLVSVDAGRQKIKGSPEYNDSETIDQTYERRFRDHYGGVGVLVRP